MPLVWGVYQARSSVGNALVFGGQVRSNTLKGWGTGAYMSPEAWAGVSLDWRSDQYALGVVFFELATLRRPFDGTNDDLKSLHLFTRPPRIESVVADFPLRLSSIVARMLEKRVEDRYQSWEQVDAALSSAAEALAVPGGTDPLVQKVISTIESDKEERLRKEERQATLRRESTKRADLIKYWWDTLSVKMVERFDAINREAGNTAIRCSVSSHGNHRLTASFYGTTLSFELGSIPSDASADVIGWGTMRVGPDATPARGTTKRICLCNLLLVPEPAPYGQWYEVSMEVSALMSDVSPSDLAREGVGRYEIVGANRLVLALDWQGLLAQRAIRNVMSLVQYREKGLDFDATFGQCLDVLISNAS